MSTETRVRVSAFRLVARRLVEQALAERGANADLSRVREWSSIAARSADLAAALAVPAQDLLAQPTPLEQLLEREPVLARVAQARDPRGLANVSVELERAREMARLGRTAAAVQHGRRAQRHLASIVTTAHRDLSAAEADGARHVVADVLRAQGYDDLRQSAVGALRARRSADGRAVYAAVELKTGTLSLDLAGHDGVTCRTHLDELLTGLRERGLELVDAKTNPHGCATGGTIGREIERGAAVANPSAVANEQARSSEPKARRSMPKRQPQPVGTE